MPRSPRPRSSPRGSAAACGALGPTDDLWKCENIVEVFPTSYDPTLVGVGSSPWVGDASNVGVVPNARPNADAQHRQIARQVAIFVPDRRGVRILGIRQLYEIGTSFAVGSGGDTCHVPLRKIVTTPTWSFPDGNVSVFLRKTQLKFSTPTFDPAGAPASGMSPGFGGTDTATLYNPPLLPTYTPPGGGIPPGTLIPGINDIRSIISPWNNPVPEWNVCVKGPALVQVFSSVKQTDPATRCKIDLSTLDAAQLSALGPEDLFSNAFENVVYTRVAVSLIAQLIPSWNGRIHKEVG